MIVKIKSDDKIITGINEKHIVQQMLAIQFDNTQTIEEYMQKTAKRVNQISGKVIDFSNEKKFLETLGLAGFIEFIS